MSKMKGQIMEVDDLRGRAVVSLLQAEKLGAVDDVLVDLKQHRLGGLVLRGGLFRGGPVVSWDKVRTVGHDAVMVDNSSAAASGTEAQTEGFARLASLRGMKMVTDAGELIGTLDSIALDPSTGQITHYYVVPLTSGRSRAEPRFMVPPAAIAGVGKDIITIDARVIEVQRQADSAPQ